MRGARSLFLRVTCAVLALACACRGQEDSEASELVAWLADELKMILADHEASLRAARSRDLDWSGLTRSESRFGLELLREAVTSEPAANHLVAPLGAFLSLSLAAEAASPALRERLDAVLHVQDLDRPSLRRAIGTLRASFAAREDTQVDVACAVWLNGDLQPSPEFSAVADETFGASVSALDFASPEALETVNAWAEAATRGAVPQALLEIEPDRPCLLTTVTSVSASWLWPFGREESAPHDFTDAAGQVSQPVMMHILQIFPYVHDDRLGAQIVGLACHPEFAEDIESDKSVSLYVILPDVGRSLAEVLARLLEEPLSWRFAKLVPRSGEVTLPRFQFESRVSLSDALDRLGLEGITEDAALPGLALGTSLGLDVRDSNSITVDEDGPRAVSVMATTPFGLNDQPAVFSFVADRPFIYILFDEITGATLFAGVMAQPD